MRGGALGFPQNLLKWPCEDAARPQASARITRAFAKEKRASLARWLPRTPSTTRLCWVRGGCVPSGSRGGWDQTLFATGPRGHLCACLLSRGGFVSQPEPTRTGRSARTAPMESATDWRSAAPPKTTSAPAPRRRTKHSSVTSGTKPFVRVSIELLVATSTVLVARFGKKFRFQL